MPNRHRSREFVVQFVYQWSVNPCDLNEIEKTSNFFWERNAHGDENKNYFLEATQGVIRALPEIDAIIESLLENWKMSRLAKVDLAILRVALFELRVEEKSKRADIAVVIDEAIEIAKKFGSKDSPSFINGILDRAALK